MARIFHLFFKGKMDPMSGCDIRLVRLHYRPEIKYTAVQKMSTPLGSNRAIRTFCQHMSSLITHGETPHR